MIKESLHLYKRLLPFVLPYWKRIALVCACALPLSACTAGIVYLMETAIDDVFLAKDLKMLKLLPIVIVLLYTVKGTFQFLYQYLMGYTGTRIINNVRNLVYNHLQTLPLSFFIKNTTGMLMARVTNDVNLLQRAINKSAVDIFKELFTVLWLTIVLFDKDVTLACISLLILPWVLVPIMRLGKRTRKISTRGQEKIGKISTFVHETITGCRIVKAFGM